MRSLTFMFASMRRSTAAALAITALLAASLGVVGVTALGAADPPSTCGSAGTSPWPAFSFNTFSSGRYTNVTTFNSVAIDAIPEVQGSSTATGTFTTSGSNANLTFNSAGQLDVIWRFVEAGTTNPVPVLASWTIGDIDSVVDTPGTYLEAVRVSTDDLFGFQLSATTAIIPNTGTPGEILFPGGDNNDDTPTPGDSLRDSAKVQLDFAGTSQASITYFATSSNRIFNHKGDGPDISVPACTGIADHDGDGLADIDDPDDDNDGITDIVEGDGDTDGDGVPDYKDLDSDNDGIGDVTEDQSSSGTADFDSDGTPNYLDLDSDGDTIVDALESGHAVTPTSGVIPGPYGANGWADSVDTVDDETDGTLVTENYTLLNADGGTVDFLENADLQILSVSSPSVVPGEATSVLVTVQNNGIGTTGGLTISYPLPANTTLDAGNSPGCTFSSPNVECAIAGPIADGATASATITLDTSPSAAAGTAATSASFLSTSTPDNNSANDTAAGSFTFLDPIADIEVTALSSPSVTPGLSGTVTVDYANHGPSDAAAFEVTYPLPADTSFVSGGSTAGCVLNGTSDGVICTVTGPTALNATGSVTIELAVSISATAGATNVQGAIENQVATDDVSANDSLAATFTVGPPAADIEVSATTPSIIPGDTGTTTITMTYQSGPSAATASELVYVLPTGVTVSGSLPGTCVESPVGTVTCGPVDLTSGFVSYDIDILVAATATPSSTLDGTLSATTTATDADGASGDADVTTLAAESDLVVTVTDPASPVVPGTAAVVTIATSNSGPSDATAAEMVYILPTGVLVDPSTSLPAGCVESPAGTVTCTIGTITTAGPSSLDITVLMPSDATPSTSFADGVVSATTASTDGTPANNTGLNSTITSDAASADLAIVVDSSPTLAPGAAGQILATVSNIGPSDAGSVDVVLALPAGLSFDATGANPNACVALASTVSCALGGPIVDGAPVSVVLPVQLTTNLPSSGAYPGTSLSLQNQSVTDPVSANDSATATVVLDLTGDSDGDGVDDVDEIDPQGTGTPADTDDDGVPDYLDLDSDNDGILDVDETNGGDPTTDTDADGVPDYRDLDSDNDGIPDVDEGGNGPLDVDDDGMIDSMLDPATGDTNDDGLADSADTAAVNTDGVGPQDYRDLDADDDGVLDVVEGGNAELDLDDNGEIDAMVDPATGDTNDDGLADAASTNPPNTDGVGAPDFQDLDSDGDGVDDVDEGGNGQLDGDDDGMLDDVGSNDADGDGVHDGAASPVDTDNDGIPDVSDADSDGDGITDLVEGSADTDGDGIPNYLDLDSDNDGITDVDEGGNAALDIDGNGVIDDQSTLDANGDGLADSASQTPVNSDGDSDPDFLDLDSDGDGLTDVFEAGNGALDADDDGEIDAMANPTTGDTDDNGLADAANTATVDTDNDGTPDFQEVDSDGDSIPDSVEAGPDTSNPVDTDNDGTPDFRDLDSDGDTIVDVLEAGVSAANPTDTDSDGAPDFQDTDSDDDGIPDSVEVGADPLNPVDTDLDGTPDFQDTDSDNDGLDDAVEAGVDPLNPTDADQNGIPDYRDLDTDGDGIPDAVECGTAPTGCADSDNDGTPDHLDLDSDDDGIPDSVEAGAVASNPVDTDEDGTPDFQDTDSDDDGISDALEAGTTPAQPVDTDEDGTPDFQDLDSDDDGFSDTTEFDSADPTTDADEDGVPDFRDPDVTRILGVVLDADGTPLAGVDIIITDAAGTAFTVTTETDGSYELVSTPAAVVSPGPATVTAVLSSGVTITEAVTVVGGVSVERNLQGVQAAPPLAFTGASSKRIVLLTFPLFATGLMLLLLAAKLQRDRENELACL